VIVSIISPTEYIFNCLPEVVVNLTPVNYAFTLLNFCSCRMAYKIKNAVGDLRYGVVAGSLQSLRSKARQKLSLKVLVLLVS
jgi:CIDE-N domain